MISLIPESIFTWVSLVGTSTVITLARLMIERSAVQ